jgi:hypothetical protein
MMIIPLVIKLIPYEFTIDKIYFSKVVKILNSYFGDLFQPMKLRRRVRITHKFEYDIELKNNTIYIKFKNATPIDRFGRIITN